MVAVDSVVVRRVGAAHRLRLPDAGDPCSADTGRHGAIRPGHCRPCRRIRHPFLRLLCPTISLRRSTPADEQVSFFGHHHGSYPSSTDRACRGRPRQDAPQHPPVRHRVRVPRSQCGSSSRRRSASPGIHSLRLGPSGLHGRAAGFEGVDDGAPRPTPSGLLPSFPIHPYWRLPSEGLDAPTVGRLGRLVPSGIHRRLRRLAPTISPGRFRRWAPVVARQGWFLILATHLRRSAPRVAYQ